MSELGVREAVRELGRAVRTLVRALVSAVGRKHPASVAGPDSGPPQEWLDLVAETDPDWLARSAWADRAPRPRRSVRRPRQPERTTRIEPEWESGGDSQQPHSEPDDRTGSTYDRTGSTYDRTGSTYDRTGSPNDRTGAGGVRPNPELVDPMPEQVLLFPEERPRRSRLRVSKGVPVQEAYAEPVRSNVEPVRSYVEPVRSYVEPVRSYVEPVRSYVEPDPEPVEGSRPRRLASVHLLSPDHTDPRPVDSDGEAPDRPPAMPSAWPELPRTDTLDDHPVPGLAAQLWLADRPDAMTTAQRRS